MLELARPIRALGTHDRIGDTAGDAVYRKRLTDQGLWPADLPVLDIGALGEHAWEPSDLGRVRWDRHLDGPASIALRRHLPRHV